ncbi:acyltransferase [Ideonella azotifigens]|uniref:acyltransferase n=1 Tax=Ideonella azotifigens TaxID=513160 RepID=UPI001E605767|nr:acyltransferase [Ideonella azotifigens]MCD2340002.1 acyltransferase [Ideonella azotifigens]
MEYKLAATPPWVKRKGEFGDNCVLQLAPETVEAGESGKFQLSLLHKGGKRALHGIRIRLAMLSGHLTLSLGGDRHSIDFGPGVTGHYDVRMWRTSSLNIGRGTTSTRTRIVCDHADVTVGEDCMFSSDILVQAGDQHPLIDLKTGDVMNDTRRRIALGDHVWIGRAAILMADVQIGRGAIVGTGAVVTNDVPATSVAAGVPARVLRTDTTWSRQFGSFDTHAQALLQERGLVQPDTDDAPDSNLTEDESADD